MPRPSGDAFSTTGISWANRVWAAPVQVSMAKPMFGGVDAPLMPNDHTPPPDGPDTGTAFHDALFITLTSSRWT